jgi:hypothetical protein
MILKNADLDVVDPEVAMKNKMMKLQTSEVTPKRASILSKKARKTRVDRSVIFLAK